MPRSVTSAGRRPVVTSGGDLVMPGAGHDSAERAAPARSAVMQRVHAAAHRGVDLQRLKDHLVRDPHGCIGRELVGSRCTICSGLHDVDQSRSSLRGLLRQATSASEPDTAGPGHGPLPASLLQHGVSR